MAKTGLCRHSHTTRSDQPGVRRLELVNSPTDGSFHVNILVVLAAKGKVRGRRITIRQRHVPDDKPARVIFYDAADTARRPQIAMHVVVDAVRSAVAWIVAAGRGEEERRVLRVTATLGARRVRSFQERIIQHPVGGVVGHGQRAVIRRSHDAVGKTTRRDDASDDPLWNIGGRLRPDPPHPVQVGCPTDR